MISDEDSTERFLLAKADGNEQSPTEITEHISSAVNICYQVTYTFKLQTDQKCPRLPLFADSY